MKISILGSGDVGQALGRGFARHGHDVMVGSRTPESDKLQAWRKETEGQPATGTFEAAAKHGGLVILAVLGDAAERVLDMAKPENLRGKLVLDATNPLTFPENAPPGLFVGTTDSLGERVQRKLPASKVVKCFNTVPNVQMIDPSFEQGTPLMLICGNDADAKKQTEALMREIGWPGVLDVGGIDGARGLEALVPLWARVGMATGTWTHAWKVVQ